MNKNTSNQSPKYVLEGELNPNTYKVPKSQWRKWSEEGKKTFNLLYGTVIENKTIFCGTDIFAVDKSCSENVEKILDATIWNMAWEAACIVSNKR